MNSYEACAMPLLEQLERVPHDAASEYQIDRYDWHHFSVGRLCAEAALCIHGLHDIIDRNAKELAVEREHTRKAEFELAKLKEKIASAATGIAHVSLGPNALIVDNFDDSVMDYRGARVYVIECDRLDVKEHPADDQK